MESLAAVTSCHRSEEIYASEDPADRWYRMVCGLARKWTVTAAGQRQIVDFLLPGDFFGLTLRDVHDFTVDAAIDGTVVACYPRRPLELMADGDPQLGRLLREIGFAALSRMQARLLILGRTSALQKVGAFLLEMAERSQTGSRQLVVLPMSRYDIADYLALSVETVSRAVTDLEQSGAITLLGKRRVRIIDRAVLESDAEPCPERRGGASTATAASRRR
jgi:CRP-like cAMP-binding protein